MELSCKLSQVRLTVSWDYNDARWVHGLTNIHAVIPCASECVMSRGNQGWDSVMQLLEFLNWNKVENKWDKRGKRRVYHSN